jgi:hypothetical protein
VKRIITCLICFVALNSFAQEVQIGQWRDYLPYNNAIALTKVNDRIYVATENNLFYLDAEDELLNRLSTVNGLSDVGVSAMAKDPQKNTLVVAYNSTKIDIIESNSIYSILDVERENVVGGKSINNISFKDGMAYLACSFGIIELNTEKKEIANTFYLNTNSNLGVNDLSFSGDSIYAATDLGLFSANLNDNLLDYQSWQIQVENYAIDRIEQAYNNLYFITDSKQKIYSYSPQGLDSVVEVDNLKFIKSNEGRLFVGAQSRLLELHENNTLTKIKESSYLYRISDVIKDNDVYWASDGIRSLVKIRGNLSLKDYQPSGPLTNRSFSTAIGNRKMFLSPGGVSAQWDNNNTYQGFHWSDGYTWHNVPFIELDNARDITTIIESPNKNLFAGTWNNGVLELSYNNETENYSLLKAHNYFTTNGALDAISRDTSDGNYGWNRIKGMLFDENGLLWVTNSLVKNGLAYMNTDGEWSSMKINSYNTESGHLGDLVIDNQGKKWIFIANGGGIIVYDDNGTPENTSDDSDRRLNTSAGSGGLPSNAIYSLAKDKDGEVWVGTDKGIAVFYNTEDAFSIDGDAQLVLVEADGYVEPIISNETVTTIAIDGANRKWFGTKNSGVFVYSPDGSIQEEHFTQENSPILSNTINHISINEENGEVFISTDKGLISYKGKATAGQSTHGNVLVYPNPVKENYDGPIAIKNVVENANVKITDIRGNLVKTLTAYGGQAVWDGKNKFGERSNTGVYLVFSTAPTGLETNVAKILFIK